MTAGTHTIEFLGIDTAGGDNTALIDDIGVYPSTSVYGPITGPASAVVGVAVEFTILLASPASGNIVISLSSPGFSSDTFQATFHGSNITSTTIASGQSSGTFWFTSGGSTGARSITATATNYYSNPYNFSAISPPPATCEISNAYVTTSGQSLAFFFQTISGGTSVIPTTLNYYPSIEVNGRSVGLSTNTWITGAHACAVLQFASGVQINPGDVVVISTQASWMSCGSSAAANQVTDLAISNFSGQSCFIPNGLTKTFRPGLNHSDLGSGDGTLFNVPMNWRYRCGPGYLTTGGTNEYVGYSFLQLNGNNGIDATNFPGAIGYWAIGFDDTAYSTTPMTATIISQDSAVCTVTQVAGNNNPGVAGQGQYYLFEVAYASGTTSANTPLAIQVYNGQASPSATQLSNLWIVGPGDFTVPAAGNTSWSFNRSNPYALSGQYLTRLHSGIGCARWVDAMLGFANYCAMTQPWEEPQLEAFSWNCTTYPSYTITYTEARALSPSVSPYIYSPFLGSIGMGSTWTCSSGLSAAITSTTQTTITVNSASTDPIFCGVLIQIGSEQMMVQALSGTSTLTVFRAACGTAAAIHASGAPITIISKRWAWTSLSQLVGANPQCVEFVCAEPHGLNDQISVSFGSGWPTLTCVDGTTVPVNGSGASNEGVYGPWITGPNTFYAAFTRATGVATTLSAPSGAVSIPVTWNPSGGNGFPTEFVALTSGQFAGCDLHYNIPLMASDAYVWDVAIKIRDNFPAGRRVYVELSDEPWNSWPAGAYFTNIVLSYQAGVPNSNYYVVTRTGQIRSIFRTVFGARANEVYAYLNCQEGNPGVWVTPTTSSYTSTLGYAAALGVPIDACGMAPYIGSSSDSVTVASWNGSATIQQMVDLLIHDVMCGVSTNANPVAWAAWVALIKDYTAYTGNPCVFHGYEGGLTGIAGSINNAPNLVLDVLHDPLIEIIEQDTYFLMQQYYSTVCMYSYDIYPSGSASWGVYGSIYQPHGKGDGVTPASDGNVYTNRNYCVTPGFIRDFVANSPATNYMLKTCSVRGLALRGME